MGTHVYYEHMKKVHVPTFDRALDPDKAEKWIEEVESNFTLLNVPEGMKHLIIKPFLVRDASKWWTAVEPTITSPITWAYFRDQFMAHFFPPAIRMQRMQQFENLRQTPECQ